MEKGNDAMGTLGGWDFYKQGKEIRRIEIEHIKEEHRRRIGNAIRNNLAKKKLPEHQTNRESGTPAKTPLRHIARNIKDTQISRDRKIG